MRAGEDNVAVQGSEVFLDNLLVSNKNTKDKDKYQDRPKTKIDE